MKEMILAKADIVQYKDSRGTTAGHIAATKGHRNIMQLLIESGIDTNLHTFESKPLLLQALEHGHIKTAKCLLDGGAQVNIISGFGGVLSTLFDEMLIKGDKDAIQLLQEYGAEFSPGQNIPGQLQQSRNRSIALRSQIQVRESLACGYKKVSEAS